LQEAVTAGPHGRPPQAFGEPARLPRQESQLTTVTSKRRLYVLRHVKSSWDEPGVPDHDRPLAPRGRRALAVLADYVAANDIHPELVLCSSSRRTRDTLEGIAVGGRHLIEAPLYGASCDQLIERLRRLPPETGSVMVIGHNPAMQMLILRLAGVKAVGSTGPLADIERKFPTGALANLSVRCEWSELKAGCGDLLDYVRPKALLYR
jgi:phosphohistidine phosphatase